MQDSLRDLLTRGIAAAKAGQSEEARFFLEWLLRSNAVTVVSSLDPQVAPPLVITPVMNDPGLPAAYRGQDFTWRQIPQWSLAQNYDWVNWLVFRKLPLEKESLLLWARDDLFPDARSSQP